MMATRLRELIQKGPVLAPFVYDGIQAKLAEQAGFGAVYVTGFGSAARIGLPDIGLMTFSEMLDNARAIAGSVNLPVISDADTGYGNPVNVVRTVREYEAAGIAAMHMEDQVWPKRCGYMSGKEVIPAADMVQKLRAALDFRKGDMLIIARTDALQVEGWSGVEDRVRAYAEVGADMVFVDGVGRGEVEEYASRLGDLPLLLNNGPLLPLDELERFNFQLIIHPGTLMAVFTSMRDAMQELRTKGKVTMDISQNTFADFLTALDVERYTEIGERYQTRTES
jgi:2-methylisocitrate lyase-like PEP mutase family enzyme